MHRLPSRLPRKLCYRRDICKNFLQKCNQYRSSIIECPEAAKAINAGDEVTVDFDSGIITDETTGEKFKDRPSTVHAKIIDCEGLETI